MAILKLGTRGSKLALTQAGLVRDALARSVPALAAPDAVEIVQAERGLGQRVVDQPVDALEMGAGGDLRHDAAEAAVLGLLAVDDVGEDAAHGLVPGRRLDDGDGGLVAARFDAQDAHNVSSKAYSVRLETAGRNMPVGAAISGACAPEHMEPRAVPCAREPP